jgi:hypothetical protein
MVIFRYLTGRGNSLVNPDILRLLGEISDELSLWGSPQSRHGKDILADFDSTIGVKGDSLSELLMICKEFQGRGLSLPSKQILRMWNELIFDLYPADSIVEVLVAGEVRGSGLICQTGQRLYGGHLMLNRLGIQLSASLTAIDVQSQLFEDLNFGLQALLAITSNLENAGYQNMGEWKLTLRPGMLYEEIYNGKDS